MVATKRPLRPRTLQRVRVLLKGKAQGAPTVCTKCLQGRQGPEGHLSPSATRRGRPPHVDSHENVIS